MTGHRRMAKRSGDEPRPVRHSINPVRIQVRLRYRTANFVEQQAKVSNALHIEETPSRKFNLPVAVGGESKTHSDLSWRSIVRSGGGAAVSVCGVGSRRG